MTTVLPNHVKADIVDHVAKAIRDTDDQAKPAAVKAAVEEAATANGLFDGEVLDLVKKHGYPRHESMLRAADLLRAGKPAVTPPPARTGPPAAQRHAPPPDSTNAAPAQTAAALDPDRHLLDVASLSTRKRTRSLAEKIRADLDKLRDYLDVENAALAAAKKAEDGRGSTPAATRPDTVGATPKEVRAWAAANNLPCPTRGVLPKSIRDAYKTAHQKQATR